MAGLKETEKQTVRFTLRSKSTESAEGILSKGKCFFILVEEEQDVCLILPLQSMGLSSF